MEATFLRKLFDHMFAAIGGPDDGDVDWYLEQRPTTVTRQDFYFAVRWAIWVSNKSRVAAESFLNRAQDHGFSADYDVFGALSEDELSERIRELHGDPPPDRAVGMWRAIYALARSLLKYKSEQAFRDDWFQGKVQSAALDQSDIDALLSSRIPFVAFANSQFIIRNMGGEAVKCDRWVQAFLEYFGMTLKELQALLDQIGLRRGLFDVVLWRFCERFIKETSAFPEYMTTLV